jgi:hypothetical protein
LRAGEAPFRAGQMMHQKFLKSWPEAEAGAAMQFAGTFPSFSNF